MPAAIPIAAGIATGIGAAVAGATSTAVIVGTGIAAAAATGVAQQRAEKQAEETLSSAKEQTSQEVQRQKQETQRQESIVRVKEIHQNVLNQIQDPNATEYQQYFDYYSAHPEDVEGNKQKADEALAQYDQRRQTEIAEERELKKQVEAISERQDNAIQNMGWLVRDLSKTVSDTMLEVQQIKQGQLPEEPVKPRGETTTVSIGTISGVAILAAIIVLGVIMMRNRGKK